jgi:hypothetical protein
MKKLRVRVKGYYREPYKRKTGILVKGTRVRPHIRLVLDRGAPGRGKKVIPPLEAGELRKHGYRISAPKSVRHKALAASVREDGYRTTVGRLIALQVFFKRTKPKYSRIVARDREWLVKTYGGEW